MDQFSACNFLSIDREDYALFGVYGELQKIPWNEIHQLIYGHSQPGEFNLEKACADEQLVEQVQQEIDQLPPLLRTVLTLYYLEDMSIPDIGDITGLPSGTSRGRKLDTTSWTNIRNSLPFAERTLMQPRTWSAATWSFAIPAVSMVFLSNPVSQASA